MTTEQVNFLKGFVLGCVFVLLVVMASLTAVNFIK